MAGISAPIVTFTVDQNFFVESLGGPWNSRNFLNRFPDTVYNKPIDSHLTNFLYALLGPAGVGYLRQQYLEARLQVEESAVSGTDLDSLYSAPFQFARLAEETYTIDASAFLLPATQRAQILSQDASFRNRAQEWLAAIRAGGTVLGITLAASSGLKQPVEVVENYKALYDQYCDIPLGLPYMGSTTSLNEIVLIPRNDVPQSTQQSFVLTGEPTSGWFTITVPLGAPYRFVTPVSTTASGGAVLTVPNSSQFQAGAYVTLAPSVNLSGAIYGLVDQILTPTTITVMDATGTPLSLPANTEYVAWLGNTQTAPIPYDATFDIVQNALQSLPTIGGGNNILVTGGPLPDQPINVVFTGALANISVAQIQINTGPDQITGVGYNSATPMMLNSSGFADISSFIIEEVVGTTADDLYIEFAPGDVQTMMYAVNILKPATSFVTTSIGQSLTFRQPASTVYAGNNYEEVLRYVTGALQVPWPPVNGINWIEAGVEHEAPNPANTYGTLYTNFHNISNIVAYTGNALNDPDYGQGMSTTSQPLYAQYFDTHIGAFNQAQQTLYPFLAAYQNSDTQFSPGYAPNPQPDRPSITGVVGDPTAVINGGYPASYLGLPGIVQQQLQRGNFWSSQEATSGADYLEIDLGTVRAVNFIYFEATNKPYSIEVAYDLLDQAPSRLFKPVTVTSSANAPSVTSLNYTAGATNPWTTVSMGVTNGAGTMIYTRFIRIGFTRNASGPPFQLPNNIAIPYSIEVRNLRIGRVISPSEPISVVGPLPEAPSFVPIYPSSDLFPSNDLFPA